MLYLQYTCFTIKAICSQQYITFQVPFKDVKRPFVRYKKVNQIYLIEMVSAISTVLLEMNVIKMIEFSFLKCVTIYFSELRKYLVEISRNSEAFASDFVEYLEKLLFRYYMQNLQLGHFVLLICIGLIMALYHIHICSYVPIYPG